MAIRFIFFDLGKVLVNFDLNQMMRQVSDVTGATVDEITSALFDDRLHERFELGELSVEEYQQEFSQRIGRQPDFTELLWATTEFFELNTSILPVISGLCQTRFPLGILSNTCVTHWDYCRCRYAFLRECFQLPLPSFALECSSRTRKSTTTPPHKPVWPPERSSSPMISSRTWREPGQPAGMPSNSRERENWSRISGTAAWQ